MANFPTSVYSPASKSAGQTITAAFFNDPDGEITAIEAGYLQGTARLNSSHSTVAALSVAGGSTLAGTLQVTGASTFTVRPVEPPPDAAIVYRDSTYAQASSALSTVAWLAQSVLTNSSVHSTGTNPERLTPQSTGVYEFRAQALIAGAPSAGSVLRLRILDSTGDVFGLNDLTGVSHAAVLQVAGTKRFDVTGGYAVFSFQNVSGGSTLSLSSGVGNTWFSMRKL